MMGSLLAGRPAIVTGAGRGVGRGIALALAAEGAPVAVLDFDEGTLGDTCEEIERRGGASVPVACDVRDLDAIGRAVDAVAEALGGVRILVNNAQSRGAGTMLEVTEKDVDNAWRTGPLAAFRFMRACHDHLRDGGSVVNVSSSAASHGGASGLAAYAAAKSALQSFSRAAAVEWGPDGIRVNVVLPLVDSPAMERWRAEDPERAARKLADIPVGRLGDAEDDVGRVVVFLAGPDAAMITGAIVPADGGLTYLR